MRTGLKILTRTVINDFVTRGVSRTYFPNSPTPIIQLKAFLTRLNRQLSQSEVTSNLGALFTTPDPFIADAYGSLLQHNPNHLGTWSDESWESETTRLEYEVVEKMIDLYHAKGHDIGGYVTSGATEGNLFSVWEGKAYLARNLKKPAMAMLSTSLTHYSIRKAASICSVPLVTVPLDRDTWGMHPTGLTNVINQLSGKGIRGFLIPLTIGYTSTGTRDNIQAITAVVRKIQKSHPHLRFFLWIDAALNGLIEPFLEPSFAPFSNPLIQTVVTDFHKFGQVPYSAGIILYRNRLKTLIEQPIEYLPVSDTTVSGSRPGAAAVAIWTAIHRFGKAGYSQLVEQQMEHKRFFIQNLQTRFPNARLINDDHSLSCGVIFPSRKTAAIPASVADTFWLHPAKTHVLFYPKKKELCMIYKFFFLPHVKKSTIVRFFAALDRTVRKS